MHGVRGVACFSNDLKDSGQRLQKRYEVHLKMILNYLNQISLAILRVPRVNKVSIDQLQG